MKIYRGIKYVEMDNERVHNFFYFAKRSEVEAAGTEALDDVADCYPTKWEAMEGSGQAYIKGYGRHSGRKLWQLPVRIKRKIKEHMTPIIV